MVIGLHHVGRAVTDLDVAGAELAAITGWRVRCRAAGDDPLVAGRTVARTAVGTGPNGSIELVEVPGPAAPRREVHEPGVTHAGIQTGDLPAVLDRIGAAGITHHPGPVDLGTGYAYLYVRDGEQLVTEVEGAPVAVADAWLVHGAIATADLPRLRDAYAALLATTPKRTVRLREHPGLDRLSDLCDVDVSGTWVPAGDATVEIWQFHHPPTTASSGAAYEAAGSGHLAFETDDVEGDLARAVAAGFTVADEAVTNDDVTVARVLDPDGNWVELVRFHRTDDPRSLRAATDPTRARDVDALVARGRR